MRITFRLAVAFLMAVGAWACSGSGYGSGTSGSVTPTGPSNSG
jgi:hypothetical protein